MCVYGTWVMTYRRNSKSLSEGVCFSSEGCADDAHPCADDAVAISSMSSSSITITATVPSRGL